MFRFLTSQLQPNGQSKANQDNTLRINRGIGYDNQRAVNVVGAKKNVGEDDHDDDGDDLAKEGDLLAYLIKKLKCEICWDSRFDETK
ncbi:hypothetical protein Tco_0834420 [Tanacetum coccineum]